MLCRWGRNVEVPSEDPYLTGQYALAYTVGAQNGPETSEPMVGVTLKHWLGYSVEGGVGPKTRHTLDANVHRTCFDAQNQLVSPLLLCA